ncbi:hypothetical protein EHM69_11165 [candidate division KSB1 bacterium]|nr:MAG: hypothetical protein EHM69_11165 [candidate division KSB1 bacterium]
MKSLPRIFFPLLILLASTACAQNLLQWPESAVYDAPRHRYLAGNYQTGHIVAIDSAGHHSVFVRNQWCKNGVHICGDVIYAACIDSGVKGFDLATGQQVMHVNIEGMINLNDITSDNSGNLYVSDVYGSKIYKIRLSDNHYNLFVNCGAVPPNGLWFDPPRNRILIAAYTETAAPIQAINLSDSTVANIAQTSFNHLDGITMDGAGNYYFSTWQTTAVYRYDSLFTNPPTRIYLNTAGPADVCCNPYKNELIIPVMQINQLVFINLNSTPAERDTIAPREIRLNQNYPNPFNSSTTFEMSLAQPGNVRFDLVNLEGRTVQELYSGRMNAGTHRLCWQAGNLPSGIYWARLRTPEAELVRQILLLK